MNAPLAMIGALLAVVLLAGCTNGASTGGSADGISVVDPAVGAVPGQSAAVYLSLENHGTGDALVGARCDCAVETSLHMTEDRDGILVMTAAERVDLPSGETTVLEPGRSHLMLEDLNAPLEAGSTIQVTLEFEHGGERTVEVPVVPLAELAERVHR